jgi:hypothetical protein
MAAEKYANLKEFLDIMVDFANKFFSVFLVEGSSLQFQQIVKIVVLVILLVFVCLIILFLYKIIDQSLRPLITSVSQKSEYVLYLLLAILLLFFTSAVSFKTAATALGCFIAIHFLYNYYFKGGNVREK